MTHILLLPQEAPRPHTVGRHLGPALSHWTERFLRCWASPLGTQLVLDPGNSALLGESNPLEHWAEIQGWTRFMNGWLLAGGREAEVGVANRKSLNCVQNPDLPVETWLTFHMRWIQFCDLDLSLARVKRAPLWILLGWCHGPDPLNQTDGAGLREQIQQWKTAPASLLPITSCIPVLLHDLFLPQ